MKRSPKGARRAPSARRESAPKSVRIVRVDEKGRMTLSAADREALGIEEATPLRVWREGERLVMEPVPESVEDGADPVDAIAKLAQRARRRRGSRTPPADEFTREELNARPDE